MTKNGQKQSKIEKYEENSILINKVKLKQIFANQLLVSYKFFIIFIFSPGSGSFQNFEKFNFVSVIFFEGLV